MTQDEKMEQIRTEQQALREKMDAMAEGILEIVDAQKRIDELIAAKERLYGCESE